MPVTDARLAELIASQTGEGWASLPVHDDIVECLRELQTRRGQDKEEAARIAGNIGEAICGALRDPRSICTPFGIYIDARRAGHYGNWALGEPAGETGD